MSAAALSPFTAAALLRLCPPLRSYSVVIDEDFAGDQRAASAFQNQRYKAERAAFDAGWQARCIGQALDENPHLDRARERRLAWAWADGWEHAGRWREIAGADVNWLIEGQPVRILKHAALGGGSLAGRVGRITTVHRSVHLGDVIIEVPPRGREKTPRSAWLRVGSGDFEPVDELPPAQGPQHEHAQRRGAARPSRARS